jgi:hypothetical protein
MLSASKRSTLGKKSELHERSDFRAIVDQPIGTERKHPKVLFTLLKNSSECTTPRTALFMSIGFLQKQQAGEKKKRSVW